MNVLTTALTNFFKLNEKKHLFTCPSECISRLTQKNSLKSKFGIPILDFVSECLKKSYWNDFLQTTYNNSFLGVFSDKLIVYYRTIDGSPNSIVNFQLLELHASKKSLGQFY